MSPNKIEVGKTYRNRGAGRTRRTVIAIGDAYRPDRWYGGWQRPDEPGVLYEQQGRRYRLYLSSFATWAGSEVKGGAASGWYFKTEAFTNDLTARAPDGREFRVPGCDMNGLKGHELLNAMVQALAVAPEQPARKPLTRADYENHSEYLGCTSAVMRAGFESGVRFAERMHGIGE